MTQRLTDCYINGLRVLSVPKDWGIPIPFMPMDAEPGFGYCLRLRPCAQTFRPRRLVLSADSAEHLQVVGLEIGREKQLIGETPGRMFSETTSQEMDFDVLHRGDHARLYVINRSAFALRPVGAALVGELKEE